jgi:hydrogenase maturation factor HypF (carbamoyltransferase family)
MDCCDTKGCAGERDGCDVMAGAPGDVKIVRCDDDETQYDAKLWRGDILVASVRDYSDAVKIARWMNGHGDSDSGAIRYDAVPVEQAGVTR